jgi:SulP family sulfate permease
MLARTLRGYRRNWLSGDLAAALALFVIAVPEQLATARLAGMPPITGYYAFIAGAAMFALLGSSPQLSVGADSTIAPLIAAGIGPLAAVGSSHYVELVAILAVCVGVLVMLVWLLRLGWIAELLSAPITTGFLAGVAVVIVIHQLPDLLGLPAVGGSNLNRLSTTLGHLADANAATAAIGLGTFALALGLERIDRRIPGALVALVAGTVVVAAFGLADDGVAVLGTIANGVPHVGLPGLSTHAIGRVAPIAGIVALVVVTQSAATTRAFAAADDERDVGRDLLGVGAGNVLAGLTGSFAVNASPPRTAAVVGAGGHSQVSGLVAAGLLIALVPATGLLTDVPLATLAGVLMFVAVRIFNVPELVAIGRFSRLELGLALVTLLAVVLIGVEQGIGVAVALAILDRTRLSARPRLHVLGRIPGSTSWAPLPSRDHPVPEPGLLVVLFATPLWYANASHFSAQLRSAIDAQPVVPRLVVLDALGMSDIDYTGARALAGVLDELERRQITFAVARAGDRARAGLAAAGLTARIGPDRFFSAVDEAVRALDGH